MSAKEDGEKFLAENASNDYIKVTASGLQYESAERRRRRETECQRYR